MTHRSPLQPAPADYHEYYSRYVDGVPDGDVVEHLRAQREELLALVESVPADRRGYRYADGKWTIEEVLGHVVDTERAFAYRIMCFVRGMADVEQPGIDQDVMVPASGATERGLESIAHEFDALRRANLELFETLDDDALSIRGRASGTGFTVRSVLYIVHGHAAHHAGVVRERYLAS
ncbi:MAG: DinB family protein [Planctomycetota bacterium]